MSTVIKRWHAALAEGDLSQLDDLLAPKCVFYSPVVFKPQEGRRLTKMYLQAAYGMFQNSGFHYVKEIVDTNAAVLEFHATVDDVSIDGIDMITWNDQDQIIEFKVMIRPYKAINCVKDKMLDQLGALSAIDKTKLKLGTVWDKLRRA